MQPKFRLLLMTVSVILFSFVGISVFGQATVSTSKPDYHPGEYVLITGAGWQPGENVSLHIVSDCGCTDVAYTAVADGSGKISNNSFLILESHLGTTFTITATGQSSGETTVAYFTDANFDVVTDMTWTQFIAANPTFTSGDQITIKKGAKLTINSTTAACASILVGFNSGASADRGNGTLEFANTGSPLLTVAGSITLGDGDKIGTLNVISGATLTLGDGNDFLTNANTSNLSLINISGGNVNINGRLTGGANSTTTITGGTIKVDPQGSSSLGATVHVVEFVGTANISFTGGTLIIVDPHAASNSGNALQIVSGGTKNFAGSTIQFGDGISSTSGSADGFDINGGSGVVLGNVVINNPVGTNRHARLVTNSASIGGNLTITSGNLQSNSLGITLSGNWTNNGTYTIAAVEVVSLAGAADQVIAGNPTTFSQISIDKSGGVVTANANANLSILNVVNGTLLISNGVSWAPSTVSMFSHPSLNTSFTLTGGGTINCTNLNVGTTTNPASNQTTVLNSSIANLNVGGNISIRSNRNNGTGNTNNASFIQNSGIVSAVSVNPITANNAASIATIALGNSSPELRLSGATPFGSTGNSGIFTTSLNGTGATVVYIDGNQSVLATSYTNITLAATTAATGNKAISPGTTVYGTCTIQGNAVPTTNPINFGPPSATLQYLGGLTRTTSNIEFPTLNAPFNLIINSPNGVTLHANRTVNGTVDLTSGLLTTNANTLTMGATGSVINASSSGYVNGKLQWNVASGTNVSKTFYIGDATNYAPATVVFDNVTTGGTMTGSVTGTDHFDISNSGISSTKSVNHTWTLINNGVVFNTSTNRATVTLNWAGVGTDADAGSNPTKYIVAKYDNPTWTLPVFANRTSTSIQATGISSFSDFIVGEPANTAPSVTDVSKSVNEDNTLTFTSTDFTNHFTDPESNSLTKIKIISLPSNGTLKLNTTNVNVADEIVFTDLGNLNFVPNANYNGNASFNWNGSDGSLYATTPANVSITINSVNDAPSGTDKIVTTNEDVDYTFTATDFGFTDPNDNPANNFFAVKLTNLPAAGNLTLNGTNIPVAGTVITIADINAGNLKFHPATNATGNGYASFIFQVQDDGGTSNSGVDLDASANTITINVTPVNDAPTVSAVTKNGNEDNTISFTSPDFTAHFSDVDGDALAKIKITSLPSASAGVLKLSGVAVLINAEIITANISNLTFEPAANYNGSASFGWNGSDGALYAATGANVNITIDPVNDPPTVANVIADVTVDEDADNTVINLANTFDDIDEDLLMITIQGNTNTSLVTATYNNETKQLTLDYATNAHGTATITIRAADGSSFVEDEFLVTVHSVNDAPSGAANTVTTNEDVDYTFTASDFGFSDVNDNPTNSFMAVKLTTLPSTGTLKLNGSSVTLAGTSIAIADINAGNLKFHPVANGNGLPYTSFTFQVQDNGGTSFGGVDLDPSAKTMTINVTAVNDASSITDIPKSGTEDVTVTFTAADFASHYSDIENDVLSKVKIISLPLHGTLKLSGVNVALNQEIPAANLGNLTLVPEANYNGNISFAWNGNDGIDYAVTGANVNIILDAVNDAPTVSNAISDVTDNEDASNRVINLTNTFTDIDGDALTISVASNTNSTLVTASYNAATKELTLHYNANKHGTATIAVEASDGNLSVQDQFLITVNSVNDAPAGTDNTVITLEDQPYTFTTADFGFTDPNDNPANNLHSVKITTLATAGTLKLNGTTIAANDLITLADINAGNFKFYPAANANGNGYATFTFQVKDDGGTTNGGIELDASANTITINVTSVNDAPSGTDKTVTTPEDNDYTFTATNFGFNDADGNSLLAVKITSLPGAGSLTNNGVAVTTSQSIGIIDINSGKLKFSPAANANGNSYASFTFKVQDNGGTDNGGVDLDPSANTITINVTPVNDAPTVSNVSKSGTEDVTVNFSATDFSLHFSDVDGDLLNKIKITSLPSHGILKLSGANVILDQEITTANIANLTLVPDLNYNGNISFGWNGSDGTVYGLTGALVNITLDPVNDAPTVANAIADVTVNEDATNTVINLTNTFADVDGDALTISVNNNSNTILLSASYNAGTKELTLHYNANKNGTAAITIRAFDGNLYVDDQFNVTVRSVNDAPAGSDKAVNINEDHSYTFSAADFGFNDPNDDPANTLLAVKVTTMPASGTLKLSGVDVAAGDVIPVGSIGNLVFNPANNANGSPYSSFTFQVQDNGGIAYGGIDLDPTPNTITINVAAVNDAPVFIKGVDQTVLEDAGAQTVNSWATAIDDGDPEVTQTLSFVVTNNTNPSLFSTAPAVDASGNLTYTPAANANGSATIIIKITDNGGTANSGVSESATQTFVINVTAVNDAPSFTKGVDQTVNEDAGPQTVNGWATNLSKGGGSDESIQTLSFEITNNTNTALFSTQPSVDASGNLAYTLAANAHGNATITLKIKDNGGTANGGIDESATQAFTITVRSVNDAPSGTDKTITILEDNIYTFDANDFGFADANDNPANNFYAVKIPTVPLASTGVLKNNETTVTAGNFVLVADIIGGKLKFYPASNGNGSPFTSFTFQVQDDGGTLYGGVDIDASANTITLNVTPVNDVPVFTKGANQTVLEDAGAQTVVGWATGINDGDPEVTQTLTFNVSNNNTGLFSVQPAIDPATGNLTFTPAANVNGTATVTVTLKDNGGIANGGVDETATQTFMVTVTAVNDVPVFTKGANQTHLEDAGAITVNGWATGMDDGDAETSQTLTFHVSNNNNSLFSVQPSVDPSTGTLSYTLAANANGIATVTVYVTDNGGILNGGDDRSDDQTFTITVTSVNDAPAGADKTLTVLEDNSYPLSASDFGFTDANDNPANALAAVKITTLPLAGTLTNNGSPVTIGMFISAADIIANHLVFTPAANANGSPYTSFTFQVQDDGGTANSGVNLDPAANTITINVTPVNDAPVFTKGADQTVLEDAGAQSIAWATGIDDGDPEVTQTLSFVITGNTNPGLFSMAPSVSSNGTLTYTPAANANGAATISIKITDNGGTANGGFNESGVQTFVINVTAVNDAPSFIKGGDQIVNEDAGAQTVTSWATAIDDGDPEVSQTLTFVITGNTNTALFSTAPAISSAGTLTYTPAANANGTATITIKITDNGGAFNGGVNESVEQSFVITVRSVNDAPAGTNNTVTTLEDNAYTFSRTDFGFSDASDNPANNFLAVKITTLAAAGTLKLNGTAITIAGTSVTVADIDANKLQFLPASNANGNAYANFTFQVQDDGGTSYSGVNLDPSANTMAINVTPVNDAPSFTKGGDKTVMEDAGPQTVNPWATDLSKGGGSDENLQTLSFVITNNTNAALFSAGPYVSSSGVLTFTPALNANGTATITLKVTDNGGTDNGGVNESATQSFVINVTPVNDPPAASVNPSTSQTVQYSDAITPVTLTATDVDDINDNLSASSSYSVNDGAFTNGLPTGLTLTAAVGSNPKTWTLAGTMKVAPGKYIVRLKVSDDDGASDYKDITIYVNKEDARAYYTGAFFASTSSTSSTTANVQLAATIKDITAVDGISDPNAGDIRNARVSIKIVETGQTFSNLVPVLIDPSDIKTGIVTYNWIADIGTADSKQFTVEIKVDNYYTRNSSEDDAVVTVSKPFNDFITGGGYIVLSNSIGAKAGDAGSKNNFGFNVKFNKSGTNLQGNINTIIRRKETDGIVHVYQVKGNSMTSLSTNIAQGPGKAVFNGKASIQDITNPLNVLPVDGGASLQVTMTDMGEPGSSDKIAVTVWSKTGALWFSSNWDGTRTVEQTLMGGNLKVNSSSAPVTGTNPTQTTITSNVSPSVSGQSVIFTATIAEAPAYALANPTGVVTFLDGSTVIGTALLSNTGVAVFTTSSLSAGGHEITAYYGGDSKFMISSGKTAQVVNLPIASSANPRVVENISPVYENIFEIGAYPNPTTSQFTVKLQSSNTRDAISIIIYSVNGKIVEAKQKLSAGQTIQFGALYRPGVYILEMIQNNQRKQLKLVKIPD